MYQEVLKKFPADVLCTHSYDAGRRDKRSYRAQWIPIVNISEGLANDTDAQPWLYHPNTGYAVEGMFFYQFDDINQFSSKIWMVLR